MAQGRAVAQGRRLSPTKQAAKLKFGLHEGAWGARGGAGAQIGCKGLIRIFPVFQISR